MIVNLYYFPKTNFYEIQILSWKYGDPLESDETISLTDGKEEYRGFYITKDNRNIFESLKKRIMEEGTLLVEDKKWRKRYRLIVEEKEILEYLIAFTLLDIWRM